MTGELNIYENGVSGLNKFLVFNATKEGSFLYSTASKFSMKIRKSLVECKTAYSDLEVLDSIKNEMSYSGGAFYIKDSINGVTSESNTFRNCYGKHTGGIFTMSNTKLSDKNSLFQYN